MIALDHPYGKDITVVDAVSAALTTVSGSYVTDEQTKSEGGWLLLWPSIAGATLLLLFAAGLRRFGVNIIQVILFYAIVARNFSTHNTERQFR